MTAQSATGALEQRVLRAPEFGGRDPDPREEAVFVLSGSGVVTLRDASHELTPETAIAIPAGEGYRLANRAPEELVVLSVLVPPAGRAGPATPVRLTDQEAGRATSDREFRILLGPEAGLSGATQFVGYIPSKRAPEHYHLYDEVIYVLDGQGVLHTRGASTPIGPGSQIHLEPEQRHCLENTGLEEMRVLGTFRPAGDPSEAYLPDGTRAYVAEETA